MMLPREWGPVFIVACQHLHGYPGWWCKWHPRACRITGAYWYQREYPPRVELCSEIQRMVSVGKNTVDWGKGIKIFPQESDQKKKIYIYIYIYKYIHIYIIIHI